LKSRSTEELFRRAAIEPTGPIPWNTPVPEKRSGVYVVSIADTSLVCREDLPKNEQEYWNPEQAIIYIGRATSLSRRLSQFYKHEYGAKSPHRGGQAILKIGNCPKRVHYAVVEEFDDAEHRLLTAFETRAGRKPFGNRVRSARMKKKSG
jgi:hypothetical protein